MLVNRFHAELARRVPPELEGILAGLTEAERAALSSPQDLISASTQAAIEEYFVALGARGAELAPAPAGPLHEGPCHLFTVG